MRVSTLVGVLDVLGVWMLTTPTEECRSGWASRVAFLVFAWHLAREQDKDAIVDGLHNRQQQQPCEGQLLSFVGSWANRLTSFPLAAGVRRRSSFLASCVHAHHLRGGGHGHWAENDNNE